MGWMMSTSKILDEAAAAARLLGVKCTGWHIDRDADGYSAWLSCDEEIEVDDDEGNLVRMLYSRALTPEEGPVEVHDTSTEAAQWVLDTVPLVAARLGITVSAGGDA